MSPTWFLKPGFRARPVRETRPAAPLHTQGGLASDHFRGATCTTCEHPLLLIWTLDREDPRFERIVARSHRRQATDFARWKRHRFLPLLYCWRCATDMTYRLVSQNRIEVLDQRSGEPSEDFPYANYPDGFEEHALELEPIPEDMRASYDLACNQEGWLDDEQTTRLAEWLDCDPQRIASGFPPPVLQVGGIPQLAQGKETLQCKNPKCEHHTEDDMDWSKPFLRVFAVVHDHEELPMVHDDGTTMTVQVVFWTCIDCHSIRAVNRCD
ncbi:MAG: hypothetical protein KDC95_12460 [Planctomycetes bacterium]|nr:hypothetical protein [Planctomycetota bacterium]